VDGKGGILEALNEEDRGSDTSAILAYNLSLHPGKSYITYLFYEKPAADPREARLTLPAKELGGTGAVRLRVPIPGSVGAVVGKPADSSASKPPDRFAEKGAEEDRPLELADVIRQELNRKITEAAALAPAGLRSPNQIPLGDRIPDPYAELKALLKAQAKERQALLGKTAEGVARFVTADRNGADWIVVLQLRVRGDEVRLSTTASDNAVALLRGLKVGQRVKVKGKLEFRAFREKEPSLRLYACTFADLGGEQGPADQKKRSDDLEKEPVGDGKPLDLADVVRQEVLRDKAMREASASGNQVLEKGLREAQAKERESFVGKAVEGVAVVYGVRVVTPNPPTADKKPVLVEMGFPQLDLPGFSDAIFAWAADPDDPVLAKLRKGQVLRVKGKIVAVEKTLRLRDCEFTAVEPGKDKPKGR
jgi:hypothetical protein